MLTAMSEGAVTLAEGLATLGRALARRPERAVVALLEVPLSEKMAVAAALESLCEDEGIAGESAAIVEVHEDDGVRAELTTLNRERDLRLRHQRLIVVVATCAEALRFARELAPDLLTSPDVRLTIRAREREGTDDPAAMKVAIGALMQRLHRELDLTGLLPGSIERHKVPIDQLFMELADFQGLSRARSLTTLRRSQLTLFSDLEPSSPREERRRRATLLLADPGAGKTTLLRRLAVIYSEGGKDPLGVGAVLPLLVPLAELASARERDRVRPLSELLGGWLVAQGIEDLGWQSVMPEMLLLLDGIDEIPEVAVRRGLVEEAIALAEQRQIAAVVLTGRSFLVDELRGAIHRCRLLRIRAPERAEVERYLMSFIRLRAVEGAEGRARALTARIWGDRDLRALVATPLLLLFLALLHEFEGRLPDRRVEIYNRLSELLVDRWVHARSLARGSRVRSLSRGEVQQVLGPLAWWIVERGGGAASRVEIKAQLTSLLSRREEESVAAEQAETLLTILKDHSALLRRAPGGRWAFVHHSVAEFFAAREAERDQERWDVLVQEPFDSLWREVILFAAGIAGVERGNLARVDALVDAVLQGGRRSGRYEARYPSLMVGLLREDPQLSRRQQAALIERLCEFWFEHAFYRASANQVQYEAVAFLEWAVGSRFAPLVARALGRYFGGEPTRRVRWDRLLVASFFPGANKLQADDAVDVNEIVATYGRGEGNERAAMLIASPLVLALPRLLLGLRLDLGPLKVLLAAEDDWRLRLVRFDPPEGEGGLGGGEQLGCAEEGGDGEQREADDP